MSAYAALLLSVPAAQLAVLFLVMRLRRRLSSWEPVRKPSALLTQQSLSVLELAISNLLIIWYVLPPANFGEDYAALLQYAAKYVCLSVGFCLFLTGCDELVRKAIAENLFSKTKTVLKNLFQNAAAKISAADGKVFEKTRFHIDELFIISFLQIAIGLMFNRALYGTEKTDEAYYYADALAVLQGNLPYAYNNSSPAGMTLLMIIPMALYRLIHPDMAGIFLYMRICYLVFKYLALTAIYIMLKKTLGRRKLLWLIAILIPYLGGIHQSFSYNSVGKYMILLSGIIIAVSLSHAPKCGRKTLMMMFVAGFFSAIGVFAHPLQASGVAVLTLLLFCFKRGSLTDRVKAVLAYASGGISEILIVLVPVSLQAGAAATYSGIHDLIFRTDSMGGRVLISDRLNEIVSNYGHSWKIMTIVFAGTLLALFLYRISVKSRWNFRDQLLLSSGISVLASAALFLKSDFSSLIGGPLLWLAAILLIVRKENVVAFVTLPCIAFFAAELMVVKGGSVTMRAGYLYPVLFCWLLTAFQSRNKAVIALSALISLTITSCLIRSDYDYVYRDSPIAELTYRVPDGVYKGIYTTKDNAHDLMELEEYIKKNTDPSEKIQFRDNTPAAYLMHTRGTISDVRTWDCMQYTYKVMFNMNNPQNLYRYYKRTGSIPDKIIYVDFGRDRQLSIEDPDWKYNKFVNSYYSRLSEVRLNRTFRVLIYKYNGNFNGDYDRWVQSAIE